MLEPGRMSWNWCSSSVRHAGGEGGGPQLGFVEGDLAPPVARLGVALGRVGPAVQLEIQLADPRCQVGLLGGDPVEEALGRLRGHLGDAVEVGDSLGALEHLLGGAATAVAVAEEVER
jgi:hypothetical protein